MRNAELCQLVLSELEEARPDDALPVLRRLLSEHLGAGDVQLLLANYELTALRPLHPQSGDEVLSAGPAGRCFMLQAASTAPATDGGTAVWLPVSVRGDRIGVLALTLPAAPAVREMEGLARLANTVAHAIRAAAGQTDLLARAARSQRLSLAAELQWQLLPDRSARAPQFELAGHLEPAYRAHADTFDWCQDGDHLVLSIIDGRQAGLPTPLLSTLTLAALRNARRSGLPPADQARLAGEAIFAHHRGASFVGALVLRIDQRDGTVSAVLAGSPRVFVLREEQVYEPRLTAHDPLGMLEDAEYAVDDFSLMPGDRLLLVTDGVHATRSVKKQRFGDAGLRRALLRTAGCSSAAVVRAVIAELHEHSHHRPLDDDAVALCLDWHGGSRDSEQPHVQAESGDVALEVAPPALTAVPPWSEPAHP